MSGVAIVCKLLDSVGIDVMAGVVPQNKELPVIGVMTISERNYQTLSDDEAQEIEQERVQVTVMTKTYRDQKHYMRLVKNACKAIEKIIVLVEETVVCKSILREFVGPDLKDSDAGIFMQSVDFMVKYQRSNIDGR